jgi:hypothetical protein
VGHHAVLGEGPPGEGAEGGDPGGQDPGAAAQDSGRGSSLFELKPPFALQVIQGEAVACALLEECSQVLARGCERGERQVK